MKSTKQQLQQRGYPAQEDLQALSSCGYEKLLVCLTDSNPVMRSSAAVLLQPAIDRAALPLLHQLSIEKKLYTRLMICESLRQGNAETVRLMIPYLGKIGKNQYQAPPDKVSLKASFPLPRDVIARTLGGMKPELLPELQAVLCSESRATISEGLDAIGYLLAHHPALVSIELCEQLLGFLKQAEQDALLLWKGIRCLSVVPYQISLDYLAEKAALDTIHGLEAQRSIKLITKKWFEK